MKIERKTNETMKMSPVRICVYADSALRRLQIRY